MAIQSAEDAKNALQDRGDKAFLTQNLESISSLQALEESFRKMRDDVYTYHVGNGFNHFSEWIRVVFGEDELADKIFSASKNHAADIIHARLSWLRLRTTSP